MTDVNKRRSEKMKQNFKDGKIKGWVINNSKDRRSYPESFFIKVFKNNNLYEKYNIEEKFSYGKYFIDFLFVELKLVLEINGEQHFATEEAIKHDMERDNFFLKEGFKIYRVRWKDVCNNAKKEIDELLNFLNNIESNLIRKYILDDSVYQKKKKKYIQRKKKKKCSDCDKFILMKSNKCRSCYLNSLEKKLTKRIGKNKCVMCDETIHGEKFCKKCYDINQRKIERPDINELIEKVKILGYSKVGKEYGVSDNTIRKWIKNRQMWVRIPPREIATRSIIIGE